MLFFVVNGIALAVNLIPLALSQYVFGFNTDNYAAITVSIANFSYFTRSKSTALRVLS